MCMCVLNYVSVSVDAQCCGVQVLCFFYLKLNSGECFEVGECECGWLVLWSSGFSVFNSKWKMDYVSEVGECECGWILLWSAGFGVIISSRIW